MLEDFNNIFNEFDLYKTINARLHNSNFYIKKTKTFNRFLITFTIIIALLQLFEQ